MADNTKDIFESVEEEYEFLDSVELDGETYFMLIPATENEDIDGEVFINNSYLISVIVNIT